MTVRPGRHDMQLFWLTMLGAVRSAAGTGEDGARLPPVTPGSSGGAMVDKVLAELAESGDPDAPFALVIDDLHELTSPEAAEQLTELLTRMPPGVRAIVATRRDLPLRLHRMRLAGDLTEIRAAQLRFTEHETRRLLTAAGIALPEPVVAMLHQRTEGWAAGLRLAVLSLAGHPDPERFVAEFSGSDRTVAEYLMTEMLERQPPEVLRVLLRTSVLDRVDGELADLLTGATGSERIGVAVEPFDPAVDQLEDVAARRVHPPAGRRQCPSRQLERAQVLALQGELDHHDVAARVEPDQLAVHVGEGPVVVLDLLRQFGRALPGGADGLVREGAVLAGHVVIRDQVDRTAR